MPLHYPFSAIVGCEPDALGDMDDMGLALILATISPDVGGVLIRGEKGTAKSTAVRALAAVLPPIEVYADDRFSIDPSDSTAMSPDGPFDHNAATQTRPVRLVELPVGTTEDRVAGSLHLQSALSQGEIEFEPGLLAKAHRGMLYVDEVNLLHDHLVDLLLDAAAMGRVTVERDGVSVEHTARFNLIGTMNPEEGELRPQLLDRFGLSVEVGAPREPQNRVEVVRRRMAFDADPEGFAARYSVAEKDLAARIAAAQDRIADVVLTEAALLKIAEVCATFEVDGLRADIVTARTAVAHAAWVGRDTVTRADIRRAAILALPHRRRRNPFDAPGLDEDLLDQILGDDELPPDPPQESEPDNPPPPGDREDPGEGPPDPPADEPNSDPGNPASDEANDGSTAGDSSPVAEDESSSADPPDRPAPKPPPAESDDVVKAAAPYRPRLFTARGLGAGTAGRRSRAISTSGRRVGAQRPEQATGSLHLVETLRAAARGQGLRHRACGRLELRAEDLRTAVREGREANLVLFCVDGSGSMAARKRMTQVKTAVLSLLLDAYRRRDKVGLITFRGHSAALVLPPTHSVDVAAARLDDLPAGGRTPLSEGLLEAATVLQRERRRDPRLRPLLILVTDGRATAGPDAVARSRRAAEYVAELGVTTIVVDGETGAMRLGLASSLAQRLRAEHLPVAEVNADALTSTVRERVA